MKISKNNYVFLKETSEAISNLITAIFVISGMSLVIILTMVTIKISNTTFVPPLLDQEAVQSMMQLLTVFIVSGSWVVLKYTTFLGLISKCIPFHFEIQDEGCIQ